MGRGEGSFGPGSNQARALCGPPAILVGRFALLIVPSLCPIVGDCQGVEPNLSSSRGLEPVPALDRKGYGVKITPVGVEVLEVEK